MDQLDEEVGTVTWCRVKGEGPGGGMGMCVLGEPPVLSVGALDVSFPLLTGLSVHEKVQCPVTD